MATEETRWAFASSVRSAPHGNELLPGSYSKVTSVCSPSVLILLVFPPCPGGLHSAYFLLEERPRSWPALCPAPQACSQSSAPVLCTTELCPLPPCWFSASNLFLLRDLLFKKKKKLHRLIFQEHLLIICQPTSFWSLLPALPDSVLGSRGSDAEGTVCSCPGVFLLC